MTKFKDKYIGKKALVIDDDIDYQGLIKFHLENYGFEVIIGSSQAEGEELIKQNNVDIAIFDLMMENSDSGFILSYKFKQKFPKIPVIIITNVTNETGFHFDVSTEEMRSWIKADAIIDKDIRNEQLYKEVHKLLG